MAHGQAAPTAAQTSRGRLARGRTGPRVPQHQAHQHQIPQHPASQGQASQGQGVGAAGSDLLWPGMTGPVSGTPPRRPGSIRRTTSVMMERPEGLTGPLHLIGVGRDLLTTATGATHVLGEARLRVVLDYMAAPGTALAVSSEPAVPALADLVGTSTRAGFRSAARRALGAAPDGAAGPTLPGTSGSLLGQLLDDVPVAVLVSGAALGRNGVFRQETTPNSGAETGGNPMIDVCAGWQQTGLLARLAAERRTDPQTSRERRPGVPAGDLGLADDPLGWHPLPAMPPHAMRRLRRIDVTPAAAGTPDQTGAQVDAFFRDTYLEAPGQEIVIHEYGIDAALDREGLVSRSVARAGALPGAECPQALDSAGRIVGLPVGGLRRAVSRGFVGTSTCTHLNDTLRALGDLPDLLAGLDSTSTD